jgi:hypothetical protein
VEASDGQSCWLFLEEALGDFYSPQNPAHRALAARWLAAVHDAGRRGDWERRLPDRGPEQYLRLLRFCQSKLGEYRGNTYLPPDGPAVLERLEKQCALLEARWSELEEICRELPLTLVHGDFVMRNLVVRPSAEGPELLVFDWEFAGWGAPCVDLPQHIGHVASPDLAVYSSCLEPWPRIDQAGRIQRLAACGGFFRLIDGMYWTCSGMTDGPPELLIKPFSVLNAYSQSLAQVLSQAEWSPYD